MIELEQYAARIPLARKARGIRQSAAVLKLMQAPFLPLRTRQIPRYLTRHDVRK